MMINLTPPKIGYEALATVLELEEVRKKLSKLVVRHAWIIDGISRLERCYQGSLSGGDHRGLAIIGDSGAGKSRLIEHFSHRFSPTREASGLKMPVVLAKTPAKPTTKGLVEHLLLKLGDPAYDKGTEQTKTARLLILLKGAETRLLLLDEFQHFVDQGSHKVQHHVADWLKNVVDESGIGLVVAGLPSCVQVMETNTQLKRRFQAPLHLPRFDWDNPHHRKEFRGILAVLQKECRPLQLPDLTTEDTALRVYIATGGIIGRVSNLLLEVINLAIESRRFVVTIDDLRIAAKLASFDLTFGITDPFGIDLNAIPDQPRKTKAGNRLETDEAVFEHAETARSRRRKINDSLSR